MKKYVKDVMKAGYGLGLLSLTQAKKITKRLKKDLGLNDKESVKFAKDLIKSSEKASMEMVRVAEKHLTTIVVKSGLASKRELKGAKRVVKKRVKKAASKVEKKIKSAVGRAVKTKPKAKPKKKSLLKKIRRKK